MCHYRRQQHAAEGGSVGFGSSQSQELAIKVEVRAVSDEVTQHTSTVVHTELLLGRVIEVGIPRTGVIVTPWRLFDGGSLGG
jgi:hypothetical protein